MTRTYGTYTWKPADTENPRPTWLLDLEPAIRMRARRTFGRANQTRTTVIALADTTEVARDLAWFMIRYPLEPGTPESAELLAVGESKQLAKEAAVERALSGTTTATLPSSLERVPAVPARPYQVVAMDLLRARGVQLLTDEVGLGKTYSGLLNLVNADALPALVVPPTHLPPRWVKEIEDSFPFLSHMVAKKTTPPPSIEAGEFPDVVIVPYSKLDGWAGHLAGQVRSVIFDEVQELAHGRATAKGEAAGIIASAADFTQGLSATPINNYGGEIWNVFDILAEGELGSREEFAREWGRDSGGKKVADPQALGAYLRDQGLMLGRTRVEVGRELAKTVKVHEIVDTDYKALATVEESLRKLAELLVGDTATPQERMQAARDIDWKVRHATGVDKAPYVADYVRMLLQSEPRVVLWGWHRDVYDIWLDRLKDFHPAMYTGTESPAGKERALRRFLMPLEQDEEQLMDPNAVQPARVLIMSLRSGSGVDGLQNVCRVGVFGELDWSPNRHEQGIGRLRRDGMSNDPPVVYYLTSPEGSDPFLLDILQEKRQQSEPIVSRDGKLLRNAVSDLGRGRLLAEQILARTKKTTNQEARQ